MMGKRHSISLLVMLLLFGSCLRGSCYLMPNFDNDHVKWTAQGPFGLGDMDGETFVYLGYHFHFKLPGTYATWLWLGPTLIFVAALIMLAIIVWLVRWRRRLQKTGWEKVRKRGRASFILRTGVMKTGMLFGLIAGLINSLISLAGSEPFDSYRFYITVTKSAAIALMVGAIDGARRWNLNETEYKKEINRVA